MILEAILRRTLREGSLTIIDHKGRVRTFGGPPIQPRGSAHAPGPVTLRFTDPHFTRRFLAGPDLAIGEAYMDGRMVIEDGTLYDALATLVHNLFVYSRESPLFRLHWLLNRATRWIHQHNPVKRAEQNVSHHYNLSQELYRQFLDQDWQYSCAYWPPGVETLEDAQLAKKRHIGAKLALEPGQSVLDIGCGWGGLALHLAREHDVRVTGITLSSEQLRVARARAADEGLDDRVEFRLQDYRHVPETFDRVVSVGMFEHVGVNHYVEFFRKTRDRLKPDGVFLLHTIGRAESPGGTNTWLRKYIFPGGYTPALSEMSTALERADWIITDLEVLRMHYAETLRHWRERFAARHDYVVTQLYDERFYRMWNFYLTGCEVVFRFDRQVVFQVQMTRDLGALPITRDYITDDDRAAWRIGAGARAAGPRLRGVG